MAGCASSSPPLVIELLILDNAQIMQTRAANLAPGASLILVTGYRFEVRRIHA